MGNLVYEVQRFPISSKTDTYSNSHYVQLALASYTSVKD